MKRLNWLLAQLGSRFCHFRNFLTVRFRQKPKFQRLMRLLLISANRWLFFLLKVFSAPGFNPRQ
jgi:hypothetical protein